MAIDTTIDNAVIDFTAISNLLQTLKSHDDLFVKFASGSLGSYFKDGDAEASPLAANIFQLASVTHKGKMTAKQQYSKSVGFGKSFNVTPIVVATVQAKTSGSILVVQLLDPPTTESCVIAVNDIKGTYAGEFTVHILALGPSVAG
ncbi:hypothetical protein UFOVP1119_118 [uncultured Caudovirales phage]|uniref:Uncharacterized protein n=1 Tax=uncultured Caudovirales phage TaxID=2100421 RepID=A0A6J5RGZ9_9CAUD|nr:hypothetical protein UFOVP1119_118 [uncultured Caudovirales phage]CAB4193527.1 hypothetical protein UFOVP1238_92 [uncultured Caudovirales phage]